jgi:hypothetical protein
MKLPILPIIVSLLVILVVIHIVTSKQNPIKQLISSIEGFQAPVVTSAQCPTGYKFFNDRDGASFCCNGKVDPFKHTCKPKDSNGLCSFIPTDGVPLCSSMIVDQHKTNQDALCPTSLPHYASKGKCCFSGTDLDGYDCVDYDNKNPSLYCVLNGTLKAGEQQCSVLQLTEKSSCPSGLQKISYTLGEKEAKKYGSVVSGMKIPVCFNPTGSCIPNNAVSYAQSKGAWTDKNPATWAYACTNWEKVNIDRDIVSGLETSYV